MGLYPPFCKEPPFHVHFRVHFLSFFQTPLRRLGHHQRCINVRRRRLPHTSSTTTTPSPPAVTTPTPTPTSPNSTNRRKPTTWGPNDDRGRLGPRYFFFSKSFLCVSTNYCFHLLSLAFIPQDGTKMAHTTTTSQQQQQQRGPGMKTNDQRRGQPQHDNKDATR